MTLEERWHAQLETLRRQGRYRALHKPAGSDFSSNDYLGYGKLFWNNVEKLSRSGQASRLLRGHHEIWDEVEARLAEWHGAEAALMMTSGYVANEGLLATIIEPHDWVASDELNHASIVDGLRLSKAEKFIYPHGSDLGFWGGVGTASESALPNRQLFLVTESLFGMEGDVPFGMLMGYHACYAFSTIIDDAHATGCLGRAGSGLAGDWRGWGVEASVHTGGKALGVAGGYICCSKLLKEFLVNSCRHLLFTTALPPALGKWWLDAIDRVQKDQASRDRLEENTQTFRRALSQHDIAAQGEHYIVPILVGGNTLVGANTTAVRAAEALQKEGFDVRAIRPPTVPTARLRISIHADHDRTTLLALAEALARMVPELNLR